METKIDLKYLQELSDSWWDKLDKDGQQDYLKEHPHSSLKFHAVPLTNNVYHGTTHDFKNFGKRPGENYMPDRMLGHHFAKDPELSNSFVVKHENGKPVKANEGGRVIPAVIPEDEHFLQLDQPEYPHAKDWTDSPQWRKVATDQNQIGQAIAKIAHRQHPTSLRDFLKTRAKDDETATRDAETLKKGGKVDDSGRMYDLDHMIENHSGAFPFDQNTKNEMVDVARRHWQSKGYKGIKYINTAPNEMEHAKDPTSYIVFDPRHIRSKFAKFDPQKKNRFDLLAFELIEKADSVTWWNKLPTEERKAYVKEHPKTKHHDTINPNSRVKRAVPKAMQFVSPNKENIDLPHAIDSLESKRQKLLIHAAQDIEQSVGVSGEQIGVIGAWADGAENSVMTISHKGSFEQLKLAAAMQGYLADQKAVLVFKEHPQGTAFVYRFSVQDDVANIHKNLQKDGVAFHTLAPNSEGVDVFVLDLDGSVADNVKKGAERYGTSVRFRKGKAEFIGTTKEDGTDREQRDDARAAYLRVIEESRIPGGRDIWQRIHHSYSSSFEAAKIKVIASFKQLCNFLKLAII